jgi:hypothetical protein
MLGKQLEGLAIPLLGSLRQVVQIALGGSGYHGGSVRLVCLKRFDQKMPATNELAIRAGNPPKKSKSHRPISFAPRTISWFTALLVHPFENRA